MTHLIFLAGGLIGGWYARISYLDLLAEWKYRRSKEERRLSRSAELQNRALEVGNINYGVYGVYQPEGSPTALQLARAEADKLQEALQ